MRKFAVAAALTCILITTSTNYVWSAGFALYNYSSTSIARGGAVIAHNEDPSALFFNPALMNKLEPQVKVGINYLKNSAEFTSDATGATFKLTDTSHYIPTLFAIHRINDSISAGIGIFSNFGLSTTWDDRWEGRYLATHSELKTITYNPAVSFKITPKVFIAGGISISMLDAELNRNYNSELFAPGFSLPDIKQKLTGDDTALGYNAGFLADLTDDVSLGISYRSSMKVEMNGEVEHQVSPVLASFFPDTSASTAVNLPPQAFAGIAYRGIDSFVFELSVTWEGWSKYDELKINLDQPVVTATSITIPKNWKDVYPLGFSAQYRVNDIFKLNAGYTYDPTPVPDDTFEPSLPGTDGHTFALGLDIEHQNIRVGTFYAYKMNKDRSKNNDLDDSALDGLNPMTSANGTYKSSVHMTGIDVAYVF